MAKYPAQPICPLWVFTARLETCKKIDFSGPDQEHHLGSLLLCVLDYQAQIGIPVINVLVSNILKSSMHSHASIVQWHKFPLTEIYVCSRPAGMC